MSYDLIDELRKKSEFLDNSVHLLAKYGKEAAAAEANYKVALMQTTLKLRDSGMAVGLIDKVVYGHKDVVTLRLKRDVADVMYKATQEKINSTKLQIRILDAQVQREWGRAKNE